MDKGKYKKDLLYTFGEIPLTGSEQLCGIYMICAGGRAYVGQSIDIFARWRIHAAALFKGTHFNRHLQRAWNTLGSEAFSLQVAELIERRSLTEAEQRWMDSSSSLFNITSASMSSEGVKRSDETKERMSLSLQVRMKEKDVVDRLLDGWKARKARGWSAPTSGREKMSLAKLGKPHCHGDKISKALKGKPHGHGEKISAAVRGRTKSDAHKQKLREALAGRPLTETHKANIKAAAARRKAAI